MDMPHLLHDRFHREHSLRDQLYRRSWTLCLDFGLRGDSGHFAVRGLGIAFLMWNATYPVFIALPNRFKVVGGIVLAQQLIGLIGESLLLPYLPHASFLFAASIMRFIEFDAFGLLIMTIAFVLLCVFSYRANHPRA